MSCSKLQVISQPSRLRNTKKLNVASHKFRGRRCFDRQTQIRQHHPIHSDLGIRSHPAEPVVVEQVISQSNPDRMTQMHICQVGRVKHTQQRCDQFLRLVSRSCCHGRTAYHRRQVSKSLSKQLRRRRLIGILESRFSQRTVSVDADGFIKV